MQPDEREARKVVVEEYVGAPAALVMTVSALLALLALVNVGVLVTGIAARAQLLCFWIRPLVAGSAIEFRVPLS